MVPIQCIVVFAWLVPGLGAPFARVNFSDQRERAMAVWLGGVVVLCLLATGLHLLSVPAPYWRWLALPAGAGWLWIAGEMPAWWRDRPTRRLLGQWLLVTGWALAALSLIRNYSGGDWIGDWAGHYHRAMFFLRQDPGEGWVLTLDPVTARPPLQNLATAAMLAFTPGGYAHYQVFTTLLGTLVVLPLGLVVAQMSKVRNSAPWLPLLLMLNPMFVQNSTYAWTKLGSAAFVIAGAAFFLRAVTSGDNRRWMAAAFAFSVGVLSHYSAAPYFVAFGCLYLWLHRAEWRHIRFWTGTVKLGLAAGMLPGAWIIWTLLRYGLAETLGSSTTSQYLGTMTGWEQWVSFRRNLIHTLLPPPLLGIDHQFLIHGNTAATIRDYAFSLYQTCLPFMIGTGGIVLLLRCMARGGGEGVRLPASGWVAVAGVIVLGVAAHAAPVRWGVGHICLQPLALIALAAVAAKASSVSFRVRTWLMAGLFVDGVLGVALQIHLEHMNIPASVLLLQNGALLREVYGLALTANATAKYALDLAFLGDLVRPEISLLAAAVLLFVAGRQAAASLQPAVDLSPVDRAESHPS